MKVEQLKLFKTKQKKKINEILRWTTVKLRYALNLT